jgi:hypothetical protein
METSKTKLIEDIKVSDATSECWEHLIQSVNRAAKNYAFGGKTKTVSGNFVVAMDARTIAECEELSSEAIAACINYSTKKDGLTIGNLIGYGVVAVQNKLLKYWGEKKKRNFVQLSLDTEADILLSEQDVIEQTERVWDTIYGLWEDGKVNKETKDILVLLSLGDKNGGLENEPKSTRHDKIKKARAIFRSVWFGELIKEETEMLVKLAEAKAKRIDEEVALSDFISKLHKYARKIETVEPVIEDYHATDLDYKRSLESLNNAALDKAIEQRPELIKFLG